jgi:RNA-directed DNA polymerase
VQHAIYRVIYPIFNSGFIDQSFACRKEKGTHKAADYAQMAIRKCKRNTYTIKMDIRKFFYSINRSILRKQIERKIKDQRLVNLMMQFAEYGDPVGIPIGNLLSQTYALIFLNPLDHFVKRVLKAKFYCRYVDDFVIFGISKKRCLTILEEVKKFIIDLDLSLSKYVIAPVQRGINFVGYRTWASKRFIRKHSLYVFTKAAKKDKLDSAVSCLGHALKTNSFRFMISKAKELNFGLYQQIPFRSKLI